MNGEPFHYDGSLHQSQVTNGDGKEVEPFILTDEMRASISGNPYTNEN